MEINSIVNSYSLKKKIHMCSKRTLWSARSISTDQNYILSFCKTNGSVKTIQKQQKYEQMQQELKHAFIPVHIFDYSSSNTTYRVEAMHELDGINMHNIILQQRKRSSETKEMKKAINYCDQLIEGLQQLEQMSYRPSRIKLQSLMVKNETLYVIGTWTQSLVKSSKKKTEDEKAKDKQAKRIVYVSSVKNVLLQILLQRTEPLISGKTTEEVIQRYSSRQFIQSGDEKVINLVKYILNADSSSEDILINIKKELGRTATLMQLMQTKVDTFRFLLPLKSIEDDQEMIQTDKWSSKACIEVNHKKVNIRYGQEDGVEYLSLKYQKLKVIYTYDWIPEDIKTKFPSISEIFDFLKKQEISIEDECLVLQKMPKTVSKSTAVTQQKPQIVNPIKKTRQVETTKRQNEEKIEKTYSQASTKLSQNQKQSKKVEQMPKFLQRQKSTSTKPSKFKILPEFPVLNKDASVEECQLLAEKVQTLKEIKDFDKSSYYTGERYENMGVEYFKVEKFNESMDCFTEAINNSRRLVTQQNKPIVLENPSLYHNLALLFAKCNRPQQAIYYSRQSINMICQTKADEARKAETLNLFASILLCYYDQTSLSRESILSAYNCGIEKEGATSRRLLNTMGITLMKQQRYEKACEFFMSAVGIENSLSDSVADESQFAFIFINLAATYSFMDDYKNCLKYVRQALNICCSNQEQVRKQAVKILVRLTKNYAKQKKMSILKEIKELLTKYQLDQQQYCPEVILHLFKLK